MNSVLFWIFAIAACVGAVAVVIEQRLVRMAFWLIIALGSVAGLFFLLGADFVGATQLLIYVGGTVVLLIFGVMLTATGPFTRPLTVSCGDQFLAALIGLSLFGVFWVTALSVEWPGDTIPLRSAALEGGTTRPIGLKLLGLDVDALAGRRGTGVGFLLPFEIVSIHLLVVLIGAAYLARAKRRKDTDTNSGGR